MKRILLALDMDDTVADTNNYIADWLINYYEESGLEHLADQVRDLQYEGKTTMQLTGGHREVVSTLIMPSGRFMVDSKPSEIVRKGLFSYLRDFIKDNEHIEITVVVCTHRGFHKKGEEYTDRWLEDNTWYYPVTKLHVIDPAEHLDKIKYLKEQYPEHQVIIFDDNPMGKPTEVLPYHPELIVYTEIAEYPEYAAQTKVKTLDEFKTEFERKINE